MNKALQPVLQAGLQAQILELLHLLTQVRAGGTQVTPAWEHQLLRSLAGMVAASSSARSQLLSAKEPGQAGLLVRLHFSSEMAFYLGKRSIWASVERLQPFAPLYFFKQGTLLLLQCTAPCERN